MGPYGDATLQGIGRIIASVVHSARCTCMFAERDQMALAFAL